MTWLRILSVIWKPLAVLGLIAGIYSAGYIKATQVAKAKSREAALTAQVESLTRDLDAQKLADAYEQLAVSHLRADRDAAIAERDAYLAELAKLHPGDSCAYSPRDIERLRQLRGLEARPRDSPRRK